MAGSSTTYLAIFFWMLSYILYEAGENRIPKQACYFLLNVVFLRRILYVMFANLTCYFLLNVVSGWGVRVTLEHDVEILAIFFWMLYRLFKVEVFREIGRAACYFLLNVVARVVLAVYHCMRCQSLAIFFWMLLYRLPWTGQCIWLGKLAIFFWMLYYPYISEIIELATRLTCYFLLNVVPGPRGRDPWARHKPKTCYFLLNVVRDR